MKKKSTQSAFFNFRTLLGFGICLAGISLALFAFGPNPAGSALAQSAQQPNSGRPDVYRMVGPVRLNKDLRSLPYIPQGGENEETRLMRYPRRATGRPEKFDPVKAIRQAMQPSAMPTPIATYQGISRPNNFCSCVPPDTNGDVGPNHYIQTVNSSFEILDKNGNTLVAPTSFNSLFSALGTTPCGLNQNQGDPIAFYDHVANRWVISDFAFPSFPGTSFYQCVAVSQTSDPVAGGWYLYAVQVDPANPSYLGDYPKFGVWSDAYYFTVNLFSNNTTFNGFRVFALDRNSMINGGPANTITFGVDAANAGATYSLVPAGFRTGNPPPVGRDEMLLSIDSPATGGVILTQVHAWKFHVDFANPGNSVFGVGPTHQPNAEIMVNGFTDAFTDTTTNLVPQAGTTRLLDTVGDKIFYPLVYQNRGGVESLWASHTINNNQNGTGPMAIRWYQMNVTGGNFPATPAQQATWDNAADGLFRWMPSIAVDAQGNMAIGYSASSSTVSPSIRYAGRLASDPPNTLAQGEALMIAGGSQTGTSRWGDYSATFIDPADGITFWHTNEYYTATSSSTWATRIGKFQFPSALQVQSAVSRKTHTGVGPFDINLPLSGTPGIECRIGGGTNDFTMVVTFSTNVSVTGTPQAEVILGTGCVGTGGVCNGGAVAVSGAVVTIPLTNIADDQTINVRVNGVNSVADAPAADFVIPMTRSLGDTNGTGFVSSADVAQTKSRIGQAVDGNNFRSDVNASGGINSSDVTIVKQNIP